MLTSEKRDILLRLSTSLVADAMYRLDLPERVVSPCIRPVIPFTTMAGTAVTVRLKSQPNPMKATLNIYAEAWTARWDVCCPIMVIEVPEVHHHQGIFGDGAAKLAVQNGFVGSLIDGCVRDTQGLYKMNFTVFSRTIAPGYICGKVEAVSSGQPVCIGGVTIKLGDIIFGDNDGVIAMDPADLDGIIEKAQTIQKWEREIHSLIRQGHSQDDAEKRVGSIP